MVHSDFAPTSTRGELTLIPPFDEWSALLEQNRATVSGWAFEVGGLSFSAMHSLARREVIELGEGFSAKLGVSVRPAGDVGAPLIATGHQPDLFHPGVWVKYFLLERIAVQRGATSYGVIVDTDGFDAIALSAPLLGASVSRSRHLLAHGTPRGCYATSPVPTVADIDDFCRAANETLSTLPDSSASDHFQGFCRHLADASRDADNLAEVITIARRRFEALSTGYLEAPMSRIAQTESFRRFVVHIALDAGRFADAYNAELRAYRTATKTRSAAQPVPDLDLHDAIELPLWGIQNGRRSPLRVHASGGDGVRLCSDEGVCIELTSDFDEAVATLAQSEMLIAPKALALTLFVRMFACDLFVHGLGGGRYDRVTDGLISRYFGVNPPRFVVASLTLRLPLEAVPVDDEIASVKEKLHRLEHNPDALLSDAEFGASRERDDALGLAVRKRELVQDIARPDADKKSLGMEIRETNSRLGVVLAPLRQKYAEDLVRLEEQAAESEILLDRTYPFCLWGPSEMEVLLP